MENFATVWTVQDKRIMDTLAQNGRYIVKREYIVKKMEDHSDLYLDVYNWYSENAAKFSAKPEDVKYPIWVSLAENEKIMHVPGTVELELSVPVDALIVIDIDKWGLIVNNMYVYKDKDDEEQHQKLLEKYGIDDITAYQSAFYPAIKKQIMSSWDRLFDNSYSLSKMNVGTIWEIKNEWIKKVTG